MEVVEFVPTAEGAASVLLMLFSDGTYSRSVHLSTSLLTFLTVPASEGVHFSASSEILEDVSNSSERRIIRMGTFHLRVRNGYDARLAPGTVTFERVREDHWRTLWRGFSVSFRCWACTALHSTQCSNSPRLGSSWPDIRPLDHRSRSRSIQPDR